MKTTVELPDGLMRRVKILAARQDRKLKEVMAEAIRQGLDAESLKPKSRRAPRPVRLKGGSFTIDDIETAIRHGRS